MPSGWPGATAQTVSRPRAWSKAVRTSSQRVSGKLAIKGPRSERSTDWIHSGLRTQGEGNPSSGDRATSQGNPRICVERGMTGTWLREGSSRSCPKTTTGRRLSGALKRNQRISPRWIKGARLPRWRLGPGVLFRPSLSRAQPVPERRSPSPPRWVQSGREPVVPRKEGRWPPT
jgi:hypothetical protein